MTKVFRRPTSMKDRLSQSELKSALRSNIQRAGWSLCIGAGTSLPIFPDWSDLIRSLILKVECNNGNINSMWDDLLRRYNPDSILQAAYNIMSINDDKFSRLLSGLLYEKLESRLTPSEFKVVTKILSLTGPEGAGDKEWKLFINVREKHFKTITAYDLAKVVWESSKCYKGPKEILSFNAETLMYALINSFIYEDHLAQRKSRGDRPKRLLDFINRSISTKRTGRIQYIFNHGLLPIPNYEKKVLQWAADKLVFKEEKYLQLANMSFTWQASEFINICSSRPVVFIGVSLSDSNMRRWLTWVQENRRNEIASAGGNQRTSTRHFWITKAPEQDMQKGWLEACVFHLGIRVLWITEWTEVGNILREAIGIS